ncbi:MAG: acyl--CoA ligase [Rhodobacteraceae bacterium]|nr:acyl--CoA ligase [Paracoccaceae bacterium]
MIASATQNIGFLLKEVAESDPDHDAIVADDLLLSRKKLWQIVESYAHCMIEKGISAGDLVTVDTSDAIVSIASVFALSLIGAQYVPFSGNLLNQDIPRISHFIRSLERPELPGHENIVIDHTWSPKYRDTSRDKLKFQGFTSPEELCWIVPSSGTTGKPKYSALTARALFSRAQAIAEDYTEQSTRLLMLFGCVSRPFIIRAVSALITGQTIVDTQNVEFCGLSGVNFVCASPQQIKHWLLRSSMSPKIPVIQVSGARLESAEINRLLNSFERVEDVYGSNETIKAYISIFSKDVGGVKHTGKPGSNFVEVVDDNNTPCPVGVNGQVRIKTNWMVEGYIGDEKATAEHFKEGWFYPGDLAVWHKNQILEILGRKSDLVNIGGQKASLTDVESCLVGAAQVAVASCFENPIEDYENQLAACITVSTWDDLFETVEDAWKACVKEFGPAVAPSVILVVPDLPMTQDGVVPRKLAVNIFANELRTAGKVELNKRLFIFKVNFDE